MRMTSSVVVKSDLEALGADLDSLRRAIEEGRDLTTESPIDARMRP